MGNPFRQHGEVLATSAAYRYALVVLVPALFVIFIAVVVFGIVRSFFVVYNKIHQWASGARNGLRNYVLDIRDSS